MVGQGVLRECLRDPEVQLVQTVGRSASGAPNPKLREVVHADLWDYASIEPALGGFDACFWCLGVTSTGKTEVEYDRVTYAMTMAAATTLARLTPRMTFIYVSGVGTDTTEHGRVMWARVKGKTENALIRLFPAAYAFRPGFIVPLDGIQSRTPAYRWFYLLTKPLLPLLHWAFPAHVLTTEEIGRAMLAVARHGAPKHVLEPRDIRAILAQPAK